MKQKIVTAVRSLLLLTAILIATIAPVSVSAVPPTVSAATVAPVIQSFPGQPSPIAYPTLHKSIAIDGLDIFYREAGPQDAPVILLLHGFPTSSHMFRDLMPALSDQFHLIAPDYPGFGRSAMPSVDEFDYTFDHLAEIIGKFVQALGVEQYSLYLMDYGAPIGYRLAMAQPERVQALIIQNGNAYAEGLAEFWDPIRALWENPSEATQAPLRDFLTLEGTEWQYTHGTRNPQHIEPANWVVAQYGMDRPGNKEIQLQLFYDYRTNLPLYAEWQQYLREAQPPTLVVWGKNDQIFPAAGAYPYLRDLEQIEFHLLNTGHFALEEDGDVIAGLMRTFLLEHVQ